MGTDNELLEQIRVLRARVAQLEATTSRADPLLRALLEHATPFLSVVDLEGRLLATAHDSATFGSVIGQSAYDFVEPDQRAVLRDAITRAANTGQPVSYEVRGTGENGEPGHTFLSRAVPVRDGEAITSVALVPIDVTERLRLEASVAQSSRALEVALAASRMGLWRWDIAKNEVTWDARQREIYGVETTPRDYAEYLELIHPEDRPLIARVVERVRTEGVYPTLEHRLAPRPGDAPDAERWVLAAGSVVRDASGAPLQLMGGSIDITEKRRLERHLQRAERIEVMGQLAAGVAHNFNNLLAAMVPNIEVVLVDAQGEHREALSATLDAALQARNVVKSLLALARPEPPSEEPTDVAASLASVEKLCRATFPREIHLEVSARPPLGHVALSARTLEQVVLNLLFNARDAVEDASVRRITVTASRAQDTVTVAVSDTGAGMTEEVRRRAFEPFFTTKSPHRGTGLGLAHVSARMREVGGNVRCESQPGAGTTFTLTMPAAPSPASKPAQKAPAPRPRAAGELILAVDDEPLVRRSLKRVLEAEGYAVTEATSAADARTKLDELGARVRLVILDHSMPDETGAEALPSLRARTRAPIALYTGLTPEEPVPVDAVIEKPARPADLLQSVRELVARAAHSSSSLK